jgi:hypothetical protein
VTNLLLLVTNLPRFAFDFVITATGARHDRSRRPELSGIAALIATRGERFAPPRSESCLRGCVSSEGWHVQQETSLPG